MTNDNTDQERVWREDFRKDFRKDFPIGNTNVSEHVNDLQWISYRAGRRAAQIEIDELKNEMQCYIKVGVEYGKLINSRDIEIQKLREQLEDERDLKIKYGNNNSRLSEEIELLRAQLNEKPHFPSIRQFEHVIDNLKTDKAFYSEETQKLREELKQRDSESENLRYYFTEHENLITELKQELQKVYACVEFYADRSLYIEGVEGDGFTGLPDSDCTRCEEEHILWGGKRARETIKNRKVL